MIEPLRVEFTVRATPEHAFAVWTERCATWWPAAHTISGDPTSITFEARPGGRIVERGADGVEHVWGEVIAWEPPRRLRYWWHLFFERAEATEVEVTFRGAGDRTVVTIEQTGWDALGSAGGPRRTRTEQAWGALVPLYAAACAAAA